MTRISGELLLSAGQPIRQDFYLEKSEHNQMNFKNKENALPLLTEKSKKIQVWLDPGAPLTSGFSFPISQLWFLCVGFIHGGRGRAAHLVAPSHSRHTFH